MSKSQKVTHREARNGIYIDFEGNIEWPPSILGVLVDDEIHQFIVEDALASFSELSNTRYQVTVAALDEALLKVIVMAETENRRLFGYTNHELAVVEQFVTNTYIVEWFRVAYVNAKKPIDRYISQKSRNGTMDALEDRSLATRMPIVGMTYSPGCGAGIVGPGLSRLRAQVGKRDSALDVPKGAKTHWWRILSHNSTDLIALKKLLLMATE